MKLLNEFSSQLFLDSKNIFSVQNIQVLFLWTRLVILTATFLAIVLVQISHGDFISPSVWQPINLIFGFAFFSQIVYLELYKYLKNPKQALEFLILLDVTLITTIMSHIGVSHPIFLFLLLMVIGNAGVTLGLSRSIKICLWAGALLNILFALDVQFGALQKMPHFLITNFSLFIVGGIGGMLGEQAQNIVEDIEDKTIEIQSLQDINELIVEHIPSGLLLINDKYKITKANRGAAKIFSDFALIGRTLDEVYSELYIELNEFMRVRHEQNFRRSEITYTNLTNEKMILEVIFSAVRQKDSITKQYLCLVQNLTEIKNFEFALQQKEKLAAVGQLAAGMAHEIRNPLASISGSVQLLQLNLQTHTPEDKKLLSIVIKEIDRLNNLISEFLDYVRPASRLEDPIQLNNVVKEVLEMVKMNPSLNRKTTQHSELRSQKLIYGNYDKLKQAILNIMINSYQAMSDTLRPELYVQTFETQDKVVLVIKDNGVGISKENLRKIFEPFHTTKSNGTGLGLAITHKIFEYHNANVLVESELGKGTKFTVSFPIENNPESNKLYLKKQA